MVTKRAFTFFRDEIRANRPLISFIPGHSRTVAGYLQYRLSLPGLSLTPFRGLLVYDCHRRQAWSRAGNLGHADLSVRLQRARDAIS
jgi:hypothetical protein